MLSRLWLVKPYYGNLNPMPKHIISTENLAQPKLLASLFAKADQFVQEDKTQKYSQPLKNRLLATIFYEPSTRTRLSFESAMYKLGGQVITAESAGQFSSASKGETLEDAIRIIGGYADVIVLRHPEKGSATQAAQVSDIPVINAGDGTGQHPTQALLDLYTIEKEVGKIDGLNIGLVGDLLNGRTVHSLLNLVRLYRPKKIYLISPKQLNLPTEYKQDLPIEESTNLQAVLPELDICYMTRIQKERFSKPAEYEKLKHYYILDAKSVKMMKPSARILHPLPRVGEIDPAIDSDPRAAYFRQAKNGLYVRMSLLDYVLNA